MRLSDFKESLSNDMALRRVQAAFAARGLPNEPYHLVAAGVFDKPENKDHYSGVIEYATKGTHIIINFMLQSPMTREMKLQVIPMGPSRELNGVEVHTFTGIFSSPDRAGSDSEEPNQVLNLFDP